MSEYGNVTGSVTYFCEQRSEAWYEVKLGRFGGSTIAGLLMGKNTAGYQNAIAKVASEIITGRREEEYESWDMKIGIEREPDARDLYQEVTGLDVQEVGFVERVNPIWGEYAGCSPDGLVGDDGMIQIKCPKANTIFKYYQLKECPRDYYPQMQYELFITRRKWNDFVAYYPGLKLKIIRVLPDLKLFSVFENELITAVSKVKNLISEYNRINYDE